MPPSFPWGADSGADVGAEKFLLAGEPFEGRGRNLYTMTQDAIFSDDHHDGDGDGDGDGDVGGDEGLTDGDDASGMARRERVDGGAAREPEAAAAPICGDVDITDSYSHNEDVPMPLLIILKASSAAALVRTFAVRIRWS